MPYSNLYKWCELQLADVRRTPLSGENSPAAIQTHLYSHTGERYYITKPRLLTQTIWVLK